MDANPYQPPKAEPMAPPAAVVTWKRWRWLMAMPAIGIVSGVISRLSRPYLRIYDLQWDALLSLALLVMVSATWMWRVYRLPLMQSVGLFVAGSLAMWCSFVISWCMINASLFWSLVEVCGLWWSSVAVIGSTVLVIPHRRIEK